MRLSPHHPYALRRPRFSVPFLGNRVRTLSEPSVGNGTGVSADAVHPLSIQQVFRVRAVGIPNTYSGYPEVAHRYSEAVLRMLQVRAAGGLNSNSGCAKLEWRLHYIRNSDVSGVDCGSFGGKHRNFQDETSEVSGKKYGTSCGNLPTFPPEKVVSRVSALRFPAFTAPESKAVRFVTYVRKAQKIPRQS